MIAKTMEEIVEVIPVIIIGVLVGVVGLFLIGGLL